MMRKASEPSGIPAGIDTYDKGTNVLEDLAGLR